MTERESQERLERLIDELRAQVAAYGRRGCIIAVAQLDGAGQVTAESRVRVESGWAYPARILEPQPATPQRLTRTQKKPPEVWIALDKGLRGMYIIIMKSTETLIKEAKAEAGEWTSALEAAIREGLVSGDVIHLGGKLFAHVEDGSVRMVADGNETARLSLDRLSDAQRERMLVLKGIRAGRVKVAMIG